MTYLSDSANIPDTEELLFFRYLVLFALSKELLLYGRVSHLLDTSIGGHPYQIGIVITLTHPKKEDTSSCQS